MQHIQKQGLRYHDLPVAFQEAVAIVKVWEYSIFELTRFALFKPARTVTGTWKLQKCRKFIEIPY